MPGWQLAEQAIRAKAVSDARCIQKLAGYHRKSSSIGSLQLVPFPARAVMHFPTQHRPEPCLCRLERSINGMVMACANA